MPHGRRRCGCHLRSSKQLKLYVDTVDSPKLHRLSIILPHWMRSNDILIHLTPHHFDGMNQNRSQSCESCMFISVFGYSSPDTGIFLHPQGDISTLGLKTSTAGSAEWREFRKAVGRHADVGPPERAGMWQWLEKAAEVGDTRQYVGTHVTYVVKTPINQPPKSP